MNELNSPSESLKLTFKVERPETVPLYKHLLSKWDPLSSPAADAPTCEKVKFFFSKHGNRALIVLKMILAFIAGGYLFWGKRDVVQIKLPPPESSLRLKPTVKPAPIVSEEGRKKAVDDVKQASAIQKSIQPDPQPAASSSQATPSSMPVPNKQAAKEFAGKIMDEFDDNLSKTPVGPELRSLIDGYSAIFADAYEKGQILHKQLGQFKDSLIPKITRFVYEKYKEELVQKLSGLENPTVDEFVNVLMELRDKIDSLAAHQLGIDPERVFNGLKRLIRKNAPLQEQLAQAIFKYSFAQRSFESSAYILVEFFTQNEIVDDVRKLETSILDSAAAEKARLADEKKKEQMAKAREIREQADKDEPYHIGSGNSDLFYVKERQESEIKKQEILLKELESYLPLDKTQSPETRLINLRSRLNLLFMKARGENLNFGALEERFLIVLRLQEEIVSIEALKPKLEQNLAYSERKLVQKRRNELYAQLQNGGLVEKIYLEKKNKLEEYDVQLKLLDEQIVPIDKRLAELTARLNAIKPQFENSDFKILRDIEDDLDKCLEALKTRVFSKIEVLKKEKEIKLGIALAKVRKEQEDRERSVQEQLKQLEVDSSYSSRYKYPTPEEYLAAPPEFFLTLGTRTAEEILAARLGRENLQFSEPEQKRVAMTPAHDLDKFIVDNMLENSFLELNQDAVEAGFKGRSAGAILTLTKEKVPPKTFIIQATVQGLKIAYEIFDKFGVPKARGDKEQLFEFLYREVQALNPDGAGVSMELRTSTSQ